MISSKPWRIVRTLMVSYLLSAILLLGMTFLLYKFHFDESKINIGILGTYIISCLTGGFLIGKAMRSKRLFWGLLIGILYFSVLFLLYKFRFDESKINIGIYGTYIISCLTGGFLIGKTMRSKRFFWGLLIGILYFSLLFLLSTLQERTIPSDYSHLLKILGLCIGSSVAGSILS